jgi:Cu-Zn family superoxide dismutase
MKASITSLLGIALLFAPACSDDAKNTADASAITDTGAPTPDGGTTADVGASPDSATADVAASDTGAAGDAGAIDAFTMSSGAWVVYDLPDAANPAKEIMGSAAAFELPGGKTRVTLMVTGLAPNTTYGSHIHKLACADMMAGGHYQDKPAAAADAGANDPNFANAMNEIWLDFTTDAAGKGMSERTVDFKVRAGEAKAVVVHAMATGDGGVAGPKLACLNITF